MSMYLQIRKSRMKGQTLLEYIVLLGVVLTVFGVLSPLFRRGIQSVIKLTADQIAPQKESEQQFQGGYLMGSLSTINARTSQGTREFFGDTNYTFDDREESFSTSSVNLGINPRSQ